MPKSKNPAQPRLVLKRRHHISILAVVVAAVVTTAAVVRLIHQSRASSDPVVVAVGDIACDPTDANYNGGNGTASGCHMKATSDLAISINPSYVLLLGDNQYENGALSKYQASFDPTWGRLKAITKPSVGNHEYFTAGAAGYFSYFGAAAGNPSTGYYSYNVGSWHVVALNSNCSSIGGCHAGSAQEAWLRADLAANPKTCTMAYWHHPRFSSGDHGNDATVQPLWQALYDAKADVVLNGHDHIYERFAPQRPDGAGDASGIVEFVVGTGGKNHVPFGTVKQNSLVRKGSDWGVLKLTLHSTTYDWQFVAEGGAVLDGGSAACVVPPAVAVPVNTPAPTTIKASKPIANAASNAPVASPTPAEQTVSPSVNPKPKTKASEAAEQPKKLNPFQRVANSVKDFFVTAWDFWVDMIRNIGKG